MLGWLVSGVVLLRSGAAKVIANDIDPNCELALRMNAELNTTSLVGVESDVTNVLEHSAAAAAVLRSVDVLLIGDMFYDDQIGGQVFRLCEAFKALDSGNDVYVGDPGRWVLQNKNHFLSVFSCRAKYELCDSCKLENSGFVQGLVWKLV